MLAREGHHGPVIHGMNAAAVKLGIEHGARVTDMKTLVPHLQVEDAMLEADVRDLRMLSGWARRWCPWVRVDGKDGLLMDSAGADHLWGGEAAMLADIRQSFGKAGLTARAAVAPTIGAAWALARYSAEPQEICAEGEIAEALSLLPVAALRIDQDTITLLKRLGLKTIGALAAVPRASLARRFRHHLALDANPPKRLDLAMGAIPELLDAKLPDPPLRALRKLAEPIEDIDNYAQVLGVLLPDLAEQMDQRGLGARRLALTGFRVDGKTSTVEAATSTASRSTAHFAKLFESHLERLDCGFGFDAMMLEALVTEPLPQSQHSLSGKIEDGIDLPHLIDRLAARLSPEAVLRIVPQDSHIPERAERLIFAGSNTDAAWPAHTRLRPLRLLDRPEEAEVLYAVPEGPPAQMIWRRRTHRIVKSEGPERIAPEWWREKSQTRLRDYYRVEDSEGRRYWIYREGVPDDGRGGAPRWFVQGLDA